MIYLSKIEHRGETRIKVQFELNAQRISKIKTIQGRKWSQTKRCWHLPYDKMTFDQIQKVFVNDQLIFPTNKDKHPPHLTSTVPIIKQLKPSISKKQRNPIFSTYQHGDQLRKRVDGQMIIANSIDPSWIVLYCPYHKKGWTATLRNIEGREWDVENVRWKVPYVKQTFYQIKSFIGLKNVHFNFNIEKNIPDFFEYKNSTVVKKNKKVRGINLLDESQKLAVQRLEKAMILRRLSQFTIKSYRNHLIKFFLFYPKTKPVDLSVNNLQDFLLHQIKHKRIKETTQNQIINAIKAYWEKVLNRPKEKIEIPRPKKPKHLPNVFSQEEVIKLIESPQNLKHKLVLLLIYSAGLRLSELINIKTRDINVSRRVIFIKNGKGKKDRFVTLAEQVLPYLEEYKKQYRPTNWLIEGRFGGQYGKSTVQKIFKTALDDSKVFAYGTVHTLRHSYATHCIENGYSVGLLQQALGHQSLKTTERYLHISSRALKKLRSPLDIIKEKKH